MGEPGPHRLAVQPVRRNFGHAREKIDDPHLRAQQPERPGWRSLGAQFWIQPGVDGERAMRRNENQEETKQAHQVGVVYVAAFIEQKEIGAAEEKKHRADPVKKSRGNERGQNSEHSPVNIKPVPRPGLDPWKSVVLK